MNGKRKTLHDRVLQARHVDELADAYAQWADSYEADLVTAMGYEAPEAVAACLHRHLPEKHAHILDAGCGTGLVGEALHRLSYESIEGLDYSSAMLDRARQKGIYSRLFEADLTKVLPVADDAYDAVICVGTLTLGHVGPAVLREFARITRAGGLICCSVRQEAWQRDNYEAALTRLQEGGALSLLEDDVKPYIPGEGSTCHVLAAVVTG